MQGSLGLKRNVLTQLPVLVALFVRQQSHHGSGVAGLHWSHDEIVLSKLYISIAGNSRNKAPLEINRELHGVATAVLLSMRNDVVLSALELNT